LEDFENTAQTHSFSFELVPYNSGAGVPAASYRFPGHEKPHSLVAAKDIVYVGNWDSGNIALLDPRRKFILDVIDLDKYEMVRASQDSRRRVGQYPPGSLTIADNKLFVGQVFSEFILVIDIETRAIIRRIVTPGGGEGELASSSDGRFVYFSSNKVPEFLIIDSATFALHSIPYPAKGRGSMCIFAHPTEPLLYIGIQRGGHLNGVSYPGGNSFLAVYDLVKRCYVAELYLAEIIDGSSDNSAPCSITYDPNEDRLYIGMFQSRKGIYVMDCRTNRLQGNIPFTANDTNRFFPSVDPLSQAIWNGYLLSVNRNNHELTILDKTTTQIAEVIPLGVSPNGPKDVVVSGSEAIVSYPEQHGLVFVDLSQVPVM